MIYFDWRRSFNLDLLSLMKRKRRSSGDRNFQWSPDVSGIVKSSFCHAFTHPPPQHVRICIFTRRPLSYTNVDAEGETVVVRVTTSLTAASHEDGALLNVLLRRGNNALNCDLGLEDGIVAERKIRTHTSHHDILKELLELHFSCERSVANIYNLQPIVYDARGRLNGS